MWMLIDMIWIEGHDCGLKKMIGYKFYQIKNLGYEHIILRKNILIEFIYI